MNQKDKSRNVSREEMEQELSYYGIKAREKKGAPVIIKSMEKVVRGQSDSLQSTATPRKHECPR